MATQAAAAQCSAVAASRSTSRQAAVRPAAKRLNGFSGFRPANAQPQARVCISACGGMASELGVCGHH
jgi:hypothetical protein